MDGYPGEDGEGRGGAEEGVVVGRFGDGDAGWVRVETRENGVGVGAVFAVGEGEESEGGEEGFGYEMHCGD